MENEKKQHCDLNFPHALPNISVLASVKHLKRIHSQCSDPPPGGSSSDHLTTKLQVALSSRSCSCARHRNHRGQNHSPVCRVRLCFALQVFEVFLVFNLSISVRFYGPSVSSSVGCPTPRSQQTILIRNTCFEPHR